jgi:N-methylhydantoinase B
MASERGETELFDFGGTVEELKASCKADTHLEPPETPVFQKWMGRSELRDAAE